VIDARRLRSELDDLKTALARRGVEPSELDKAAALDERWRHLTARQENVRSRIKALSREVGEARRSGDVAAAEAKADESRRLGDEEKTLVQEADGTAAELREVLLRIPNVPNPACPDGLTPEENVELRVEGYDPDAMMRSYGFTPIWNLTGLPAISIPTGFSEGGMPIGMFCAQQFDLQRAHLAPGDMLVLATDGMTEAEGEANQPYGLQRLAAAAQEHGRAASSAIVDACLRSLDGWRAHRRIEDDVTVMVVKRA
jgi:serine/threonine protein phosphatase PrpC